MTDLYQLAAFFIGSMGGVWTLALWLSGKFTDVRSQIYAEALKTRSELLEKIEYHEKHDDTRFNQVINEIWSIKIRNAARDGLPVKPVYNKPFKNPPLDQNNEDEASKTL